jgi:hypothetical protein
MRRLIAAVLFTGCLTLPLWAQSPPAQSAPEPAPAAKTTQNHSPEQAATQPAPGDFPLDQFQNFSAIMNGSPLPGSDWDGHIYRSGNLMRMQGSATAPNYFISDLTKSESHGLAASGCVKLGSLYSRAFPFSQSGPGYKYERVAAGEETVDGHQCKVEDITIKSPKNPIQLKMRLWEAEDLQGFPIKIENRRAEARRWVINYTNVVLGPQDPTFFVIPDTCQGTADFEPMKKAAPGPKKTPPAKSQ